jgi:Fic-DOC domain mobile mystery protein B
MMPDDLGLHDDFSTPLTKEEMDGLIPSYITLRSELNEAEQANILEAETWALKRKRSVLDEQFFNQLHRRMFGNVWKWAGKVRHSEKNIGIDAYRIPTETRQLLDDCRYWIQHESYPAEIVAVRFHHRLVWIHPYPNGNGRFARLATDLLLISLDLKRFSWGRKSQLSDVQTREQYIATLRDADNHNFNTLLDFVRS